MSGEIDLREAAVAWAARGFRVFPLAAGGKTPAYEGWTESATADVDAVQGLWTDPVTGWPKDWNIGVLTGDGLLVVDVDVKKDKDGWSSFMDLDLPLDSLTVQTPSGGSHVYFRGPSRANSADRVGRGLDIRSHHGFVIAPGSRTEAGDYRLVADLPVLDCPASLLARLDAPRERADQAPVGDLDTPSAVMRAIDWLENGAPIGVEGQGQNQTTFQVAAQLKDYGLTSATAISVMAKHWNDRCLPPLDVTGKRGLTEIAENAYAYGANAPGSASPHADMIGVHFEEPVQRTVERGSWFWHGDDFDKDALWSLFEVLPRTGVCVLLAPSNAGKTFLLLELARCMATDRPFFGVKAERKGGTAFVFGGTEGSGFERRLAALGEPGRLPIAGSKITTLAVRGALQRLLEDLKMQAAEMELRFDVPLGLIVFETLSATGLIDDENDNAKMAQAVANLSTISRELGAPVIITHHPTKDGRSERGAGALRANCDYVYEIGVEGRSSVRDLKMTKARDAETRSLGAFTLLPVKLGVDSRDRDITSASVSMSFDAPRAAVARPEREAPHYELFMECLDWALAEEGKSTEDGDMAVNLEAVREIFKERKPGSQDRSNISTAFKRAMNWALEIGTLGEKAEGSTRLVMKRRIG